MHLTHVVRVHAMLPVNCTVAGLHTKCSPGGSFGLRCESGNIYIYIYLIQNSQAVKKECGPEKGYGEKRCEIQGGSQEMAVMVG